MAVQSGYYEANADPIDFDMNAGSTYAGSYSPSDEYGYSTAVRIAEDIGFRRGLAAGTARGQNAGYDSGVEDGAASSRLKLLKVGSALVTQAYNDGERYGRERERPRGIAIGLARGRSAGYDEGVSDGIAGARSSLIAAGRGIATGAGDTIPPVIAAVSPTPNTPPGSVGAFPANYASAKDVEIVLDVTDAVPGLRFISVNSLFLDGTTEPVYLNSSFVSGYMANSYQETISGGKRLHIRRDASWPGAPTTATPLAVGLIINAIDAAGNISSTVLYWQMPLQVVVPTVAPVTANVGAADIAAEILDLVIWQFRS